jgi:hypothetical protein
MWSPVWCIGGVQTLDVVVGQAGSAADDAAHPVERDFQLLMPGHENNVPDRLSWCSGRPVRIGIHRDSDPF